MLASNLHDNVEEPPNITLFGGTPYDVAEAEIAGKTIYHKTAFLSAIIVTSKRSGHY